MHSHDTTPPRTHAIRAAAIVLFLLLWVRATEAQSYTVRCGEDVLTSIARAGNPLVVTFEPGCSQPYRLSNRIDPKDGQQFIGNGATLSGARVLTNAQQDSNGRWMYTGQVQQGRLTDGRGETICQSSAPRCNHPEITLLDGKPLTHVDSYSKLVSGSWYFDYAGDRIFLADNPAGRTVETAIAMCAICGGASNVRVEGFEITGFATPTENAAVEAYIVNSTIRGGGWVIENNYIHHNSSIGAVVRANGVIRNNRLEWNGQAGYGAGGQQFNPACGMLVEGNTITGNNWKRVALNFSSGGGKIAYACNPVVRGNRSFENFNSRCYWFDLDVSNILFRDNYAGVGCLDGVYFEMGSSGFIENNVFEGVGTGGDNNHNSAVLVTNSSNVTIRGNTITVACTGNAISIREDGGRPSRWTQDVTVEDNVIVFACGRGRVGWDAHSGASMPAPLFRRNTYRTTNAGYRHFGANNTLMTITDWQKLYPLDTLTTVEPIPKPTATLELSTATATVTTTATPQGQIPTQTPTLEIPSATPELTPEMRLVRLITVRYENGRWIIEEYAP